MNIAVIGDYNSPDYQDFLQKVRLTKPEETILDLSRHPGYNRGKKVQGRFDDISESHMVIVHPNYKNNRDSVRDFTYAVHKGRECMIYVDESFRPYEFTTQS